MAKGVKILERKFSDIEKQLSGFIAFVDTFVEDDKEVLSFKLSQFDRLNAKYESVKEEIFTSLSDLEFNNFDGKITTCNEHIEKLEVRLKSLNLKYSKNNNETGSNAVSNVIKPCFRLPELSLPQFNGDIETWFIFKEQFKEIIENCGLNDKQKLQYLQSCLIGIAKHVQTVDDTYDSLFLALEQRFENKRLIINKHINALLMLKYEKFRGDSNVDLRNLVDTCTKHLRALKLLNIEHNTFSELLLIQLVMQVLDTETKRLFEMTLESTDIPKWDDFLAFLNKRCLFLENLPSTGTKDKQNFKDSPRHKSFILHTDANVDKKCKLCSLNHDLYNCDKFKNMPVRERFRKYVVAFSSDIKKIFRQIKVQEHQQDFLRILWRPSPEEDIVSYRLKTVTYGTKPAPYLATRCLLQLAHEGKNKYPLATPVIQNSTYMDDIFSGADDITTAKEMQRQLIGLMKEGCFHLYKWSANSKELLKEVPTENKEFLFNENDELVKTLGLSWRPREDTFMYQMNLQEVPRYVAELHQLKDLKIPRCILLKDSVAVQFIGFADASAQAYGACLYVKSENANETQIRLLCSKTRVAPLKTLSIPRFELLAATLLSKFTSKITKIIDSEFDEVHLFSDSKVVLDWIQMQLHLLKVFVANRVSLIQELTETFSWHHVKTKENPADLISRGATKLQLQDELWWTSPSFLKDKTLNSDSVVSQKDDNFFEELKNPNIVYSFITHAGPSVFLDNCLNITNSFTKLVRIKKLGSIVENLCFCEHQPNCNSESYSLEDINSQMRKVWEIDNLDLSIPRCYFKTDEANEEFNEYQIIIFCDASERAYGAIAYIRYKGNSDFHVNFVSSKARVAPLKKLSLPRLELLATLIRARLLKTSRKVFKITNNYILFSDSTVALSWIRCYAKQWKPFVSNRVHEIQDLTNPQNWRFVKGEQNPADIVSRGCSAEELMKNSRPHCLTLFEENWP
ncbi:DUF1758 domain-containing protein [Trichonephila clavata]|uniref:DUF1758 domain-containing protein n=1 Tax=Trichonephila clavata TaxID=2740835 RepID=A0A8X6LSQ2_TRICU|nr:DUF1758 domain-containing protein [Trichonephila clavata]